MSAFKSTWKKECCLAKLYALRTDLKLDIWSDQDLGRGRPLMSTELLLEVPLRAVRLPSTECTPAARPGSS